MSSDIANNVNLEIEQTNSDSIVYKRKSNGNGRKRNDQNNVGNKVTLHFFDTEDFNSLKQHESEIGEKILNRKRSLISRVTGSIIKFVGE